jgi:hypothetical protein
MKVIVKKRVESQIMKMNSNQCWHVSSFQLGLHPYLDPSLRIKPSRSTWTQTWPKTYLVIIHGHGPSFRSEPNKYSQIWI